MKLPDIPGLVGFNWITGGAVAALVLASNVGTGCVVHKLDGAAYSALVAKHATADREAALAFAKATREAATKQAAQDKLALDHALAEAQAQTRIEYRTRTILKEVTSHVTPAQDRASGPGCVTYGLVRVIDAAALGLSPSDLQLPPGQSDDACSGIEPSALAASIVGNYGVGHQNSEQLDALIADVQSRIATLSGVK